MKIFKPSVFKILLGFLLAVAMTIGFLSIIAPALFGGNVGTSVLGLLLIAPFSFFIYQLDAYTWFLFFVSQLLYGYLIACLTVYFLDFLAHILAHKKSSSTEDGHFNLQ